MKKREIYEGTIQKVDFPNKGIVSVEGEEKPVIVKKMCIRDSVNIINVLSIIKLMYNIYRLQQS